MRNFGKTALSAAILLASGSLLAQDRAQQELAGLGDINPTSETNPDPIARAAALEGLAAGGLLLIPESSNDRVMAFDPMTGDLIDADFIPADPDNLSTPIEAILSADGTQILVSDQIDDVVQGYDVGTGAFIATFAPAGGANTAILDNIRGIGLRPNGNLLVSVGGGTNSNAIAEFDTAGNSVGNFVANGAAGLVSPFDVFAVVAPGGVLADGDFLVPGITSDAIHRYDSTGAAQADFSPLNTFGEQIAQAANGNVLVANFSGTEEGIVEYLPDGTQVGIYDPASLGGYRGVYELPSGNLLVTNGSGVHEIDRSANVIRSIVTGVSARFISLVGGAAEADLALTKTGPVAPLAPGEIGTFVLSVNNIGPDDAQMVVVTDTFPVGLDFVSSDCGAMQASQVITWNVGTLAAAATATCNVSFSSAIAGSYTNNASVTSDTTDPDPANNTAAATVNVTSADLTLVKTAGGPVALGDLGTFGLSVSNNGPSTATNVVVTDPLPADVLYVSDTCGGTVAAGVFTWTVGDLGPTASASCTVTVSLLVAEVSNTATVTSDTSDPNPADNQSTAILSRNLEPVPVFGQWGLLALLIGLAGAGLWFLPRARS
ncbi:MAG: DUF11 domain-containing protein [Xanthomonadales bacterium]|nr:DUF11 domain-containing protein [Xanthomonadales bacterium]